MKNKKLRLSKPLFKSRLHISFITSIILNYNSGYDWMMDHYTQIYAYKNENNPYRISIMIYMGNEKDGWEMAPFIEKQKFFLKYFNKIDIIEIILNFIKDDNYILIQDLFYLKGSFDEYMKNRADNFTPYFYIIGYDINKEILNIISYKDNIFGEYIISFDEFKQIFNEWNKEYIELICFKGKDIEYEFNINYLKKELQEYIHRTNSTENLIVYQDIDKCNVYGLDIYDNLIRYNSCIHEMGDYDLRIISTFIEHRMLMIKKIEYLENNFKLSLEDIKYDMNKIYDLAHIIKNLMIKYNLYNRYEIIEHIKNLLYEIRDLDGQVMSQLLKEIDLIS